MMFFFSHSYAFGDEEELGDLVKHENMLYPGTWL